MNPSHVPLGLELGKLPPVVDGGEGLPEEERDEPNADDGADEAEDDACKVAIWQNLIPSFPWIVPGWRAGSAIPRQKEITF